ncbi:MAG: hypothetical protein JNL52_11110 [Flavobacteriales bacterium]|nr:hypothetical protein [Flavobacteriales bacterium]
MTIATKDRTTKHLSDLHFEHNVWLNTLQFCKEEITIFERRMEELVARNTDKTLLAELEHFQNQYIREREVIDELRHGIKEHENFLEKEMKEHPVAIEHRAFGDHTELRDRMVTFEKLYRELKDEFHRWLSKVM